MSNIDWAMIALYFLLMIGIGVYSAFRVKDSDDFAVAGNKIIWPVLFATLSASFLGGGSSMGRAGQTFNDGYVFLFAASGFTIQTFLTGWLIAPKLKRYPGAQTLGDIMEVHYGGFARLLSAVLSLVFCIGILGAQALAIGTIFQAILGISITAGILIGMCIVMVYSVAGGMWAVIQTDVIQFMLLGIFLPVTLIIGLYQIGGPAELVAALPVGHFSVIGSYEIATFITIFVAFMLGEALVQPYAQRAFCAPDPKNAQKGYMLSGLFGLLFFTITATLGLVAVVLFPDIAPDQALPTLVKSILPIGVTGLVLAALLAVVMSTADSYLNSTAVVFVRDIYSKHVNTKATSKQHLKIERWVSLIVGVAATLFALTATSIVDALLMSYALWAPTMIIPLIGAVLFDVMSKRAAISAIVLGGATTALWNWGPFPLQELTGFTPLLAGVSVNLIVFVLLAITDKKVISINTVLGSKS
ncbi:sodium:solute symporter family protein [Vreelandella alkaliphila]|uniref:Sodium:solute symporter n=1 Tax=Vreelandella alkaliphila TaxID=272774 RepID=A0AAJ2VSL3_9GAMM|nr:MULTISPECIES: sodium:solute symporter family protein [Halomonas]MCD6438385.1 sodium:solute symporter family protein [Halomonas sp.]MDX5976660.1 sodium:solute symporter family protein [Halomonas alkaliphila]PAU72985.1 sodium:solute symporter [Halomonas humidisoli]